VQTVAVPVDVLGNMVDFIAVGSQFAKRAMDERTVTQMAQDKAASLRGPLVKDMISMGLIQASQAKEAEAMLGAHDTTLVLLRSACEKAAEYKAALPPLPKPVAQPGAPVEPAGQKTASAGGEFTSLTNPHVGRRTTEVKESDRALLRMIGK
jgi:hypothetical protein